MAQVEIEHLSSLLRVRRVAGQVGDAFDVSITVRWIAPDRVELCGLDKPIDRQAWQAIKAALADLGVSLVMFQRYKQGRKLERWIRTA